MFSKWMWKTLSEVNAYVNVYVNVTYMTVVLKVNMKNTKWCKCLCECYI
jgi:hypothetical protein